MKIANSKNTVRRKIVKTANSKNTVRRESREKSVRKICENLVPEKYAVPRDRILLYCIPKTFEKLLTLTLISGFTFCKKRTDYGQLVYQKIEINGS